MNCPHIYPSWRRVCPLDGGSGDFMENNPICGCEGEFEEVANVPGYPFSLSIIVSCNDNFIRRSNLFPHLFYRSCLFLAHVEFQPVLFLRINGSQPVQLAEMATTGDTSGVG
jgi:hypothetical protein